jgi:uncharacterized membrane protein YhfC
MDLAVVSRLINGILMVAIPILVAVVLNRRFKLGWRLWWIGAGGFVLSQVGHIPFNMLATALFARGVLPSPPDSWQPAFNAIFLGLSAGLWEEFTRYGVFRWWAKDARSWRKGVWLGAGHGGIEAILLGMLVFVTLGTMLSLREQELSSIVPAEQLELASLQIEAYWSAPWYAALVGALERAMTIPIQICFSVMVLQVFLRGQALWLFLAICWHAFIDATAVWGMIKVGPYWNEGILFVYCLISLAIIFALRTPEPNEAIVEKFDPLNLPLGYQVAALPETKENLEKTRYN